jgi:hypothetical protein
MEAGAPREEAKARSRRIPLGYLQRGECADPTAPRRLRIALGAGLLAAVAAVYLSIDSGGLRFANHGAVIDAHANIEKDCSLCHRPESAKLDWPGATENPPPHFHAFDVACAQCHHAPAHFAHPQLDGNEPSCFSCHHDHAGRTVDLKRTPDANCTACHFDAATWKRSSEVAGKAFSKAGAFAAGLHPEFALSKAGDQKLIFNHALHLAPGLTVGFAYDKLPAEHRLRKGKEAAAPVELDCAACHERVAGGKTGDDFGSVKYEQHCAACHPLAAPSYTADKASNQKVPSIALPHGVDGKALRDFLFGAYAKQEFEGNPILRRKLAGEPSLAAAFAGRPELKEITAKLDTRTSEELRHLAGSPQACGECHVFHPSGASEPFAPKVMKPDIPDRWWTRARFSHAAHSSDCASCHQTSSGGGAAASERSTDVLMPTFQSCLSCHDSGKSGVRADCVLCHGYHGVGLPKGADRHHRLTPRGAEVRR